MPRTRLALALLLGCAPLPLCAKPLSDALKALQAQLPGTLANDPTSIAWPVFGGNATSSVVKGADIPGGGAVQITVPAKGANPYDVGMVVPLTRPITQGKGYVVSFYARTVSADTADGNGTIGVRFQQNGPPYNGFGDAVRTIGHTWQLYEVTGTADRDIPADLAVVSFQLSGAKQVIQVGQTIVQEGATTLARPAPLPQAKCTVQTPVLPASMVGKGTVLTEIDALNWDIAEPGASHERFSACGIPGDSAYRFTIPAAGANPWDVVATVPIQGPIKAGDTLMIGLVARTVSAKTPDGKGAITIRVQANAPGYPGFADRVLSPGPTWQVLRFVVQADRDIPAGQAALALQLAGAAQVLDIGRAYVLRLTP